MSLVDVEKTNFQLVKFNENLQKVILKTKVIISEIMKKDAKIASNYNNIPATLDLAISIVQGEIEIPGFDRIYGTICGFLNKYVVALEGGVDLFDMIHLKDDKILTEHLSVLFPKNQYIDKIQYIYGANPQNKNFVDNDDLVSMWKLINGVMHRAIKWVIFSQDERYINKINPNIIEKYKITIEN